MDYTALKNEITTDPNNLGYEALVQSGNDQGIADKLNALGAFTITLTTVERDSFLLAIAAAYTALPSLSTTLQGKWDRILDVVRSIGSVQMNHPTVEALLSLAVTDGVLTQAQVTAINQRSGSRAEFLFGAGTVIKQSDVSLALRNKQ